MYATTASSGPLARWRHRLLAVAASSALAAGGLTALAAPASAAGSCGAPVVAGAIATVTCTGGAGTVTFLAGVTTTDVTLLGAGGGANSAGTPGGKGAQLTATLPLTPGQALAVAAGPKGSDGTGTDVNKFGRGGELVAVTTDTGTPLLTAGSGGGAGSWGGSTLNAGGPGGDSAGPGTAGADVSPSTGGGGGGAATATGGGTAGPGGTGAQLNGPAGEPGGFPNAPVTVSNSGNSGRGGQGGAGWGAGGSGGNGGFTRPPRPAADRVAGGGGGGGGSSYTSPTATGPALTEGFNAGNGSVVFAYTVAIAPTVTAVSPASGVTAGGTLVTITGTDFAGTTAVTFGGIPAPGGFCTATSCTVIAPAGMPGTVDVQVTAAGGTSATGPADQYTYIAPPVVTSVSPASGPPAGGNRVTITGTALNGATAVTFGANPATGVSCTATTCTATAPPGMAGPVDVQVTTPGGTSATSPAGQYTYAAADIAVNVTAQPHLGILVPYLTYTLTAHNTGPSPVGSATLTASLPAGATATNLSTGCTTAGSTVTCTYAAIANGTSADKTFRIPLSLLSLGHVTVTGVRTASAPTDPNPANDTATATCTVISILLATCP